MLARRRYDHRRIARWWKLLLKLLFHIETSLEPNTASGVGFQRRQTLSKIKEMCAIRSFYCGIRSTRGQFPQLLPIQAQLNFLRRKNLPPWLLLSTSKMKVERKYLSSIDFKKLPIGVRGRLDGGAFLSSIS